MNKYIIHTFNTFGPAEEAWGAHFGDYDKGVQVATGATEEEAITDLVTNYGSGVLMNTATHTPTPWTAVTGGNYGREIVSEAAPKSRCIVARLGGTDREANAAFIVQACNAHDDLVAELERRKKHDESNRWAVMHAAGFGALLSEILGSGCLTRERNRDLYDRVHQAADDHENHIRAALTKAGAA